MASDFPEQIIYLLERAPAYLAVSSRSGICDKAMQGCITKRIQL